MRAARIHAVCITAIATSLTCQRAHAEDAWWGPDKSLHFGVSAGIAVGAYAMTSTVSESRTLRCVGATAASLLVGAAKEGYDAAGYGDPSWRDFTWDVVGTTFGVVIAYAVDRLVSETGKAETPGNAVAPAALSIRF